MPSEVGFPCRSVLCCPVLEVERLPVGELYRIGECLECRAVGDRNLDLAEVYGLSTEIRRPVGRTICEFPVIPGGSVLDGFFVVGGIVAESESLAQGYLFRSCKFLFHDEQYFFCFQWCKDTARYEDKKGYFVEIVRNITHYAGK